MFSNKYGNFVVNMLNYILFEFIFKWVFFFYKLSILKCLFYEIFNEVYLYKKYF